MKKEEIKNLEKEIQDLRKENKIIIDLLKNTNITVLIGKINKLSQLDNKMNTLIDTLTEIKSKELKEIEAEEKSKGVVNF